MHQLLIDPFDVCSQLRPFGMSLMIENSLGLIRVQRYGILVAFKCRRHTSLKGKTGQNSLKGS